MLGLDVLTALFCLAALILASWCVSEGGDILGSKYDATIIGGFVIAWLNTAPETVFFITALNNNNPTFAVGALSGSVIVVSTVALGACIWFGASARETKKIFLQNGVRKQSSILLGSIFGVLLIAATGYSWFLGVVCILEYAAFVVYSLMSKTSSGNDKQEDLEAGVESDDEEEESTAKGVGYLVGGGLLICIFSEPFITSVVGIGVALEISPLLLAFFLAPVASEAPEILESISLSRKGKTQNINIAFSNLVGGTISKTTLLLGIFCLYGDTQHFDWVEPAYTVSFLLVSLAAGAAAVMGSMFQEIPRQNGQIMIGIFLLTGLIQFYTSKSSGGALPTEQVLVN